MSTFVWFVGFGLMMISFAFLFGKGDEPDRPRITVEPWWPQPEHKRPPTDR